MVLAGLALTALLHVVLWGSVLGYDPTLGGWGGRALALIGVAQLVYMVPAILIARATRNPQLALGLIIGAALTLLLNAACWGFGLYALSH